MAWLQPPAAAQSELPIARVRPVDPRAQELLFDAWHSSPTVRALVEAIEASDLIVYVETQGPRAKLQGRLRLVGVTPGCRYLRVSIKARGPREILLPALAHELQHAVEVAQAKDVRDAQGLANLLSRIGWHTEHGPLVLETAAARAVEERVRRELRFPARQ